MIALMIDNHSHSDSSEPGASRRAPERDLQGSLRGIVVRGYGRIFLVRHRAGGVSRDYSCELRGAVKKAVKSVTPVAVGDDVEFSKLSDDTGVIEKVLPRRTKFFRPSKGVKGKMQVLAANIEQMIIVVAVKEPELHPRLIDRFLVAAQLGGLSGMVVINKVDLSGYALVDSLVSGYNRIGIQAILTSIVSMTGIKELQKALADKKSLFVGHSGVGKSSLINCICPGLNLKTGNVSEKTKRGRHITTRVELHELESGGFILDSPGLKVLELWEVTPKDLSKYYPEINEIAHECRFKGCRHLSEPDCAVKDLVADGKIPEFRYESYVHLMETL